LKSFDEEDTADLSSSCEHPAYSARVRRGTSTYEKRILRFEAETPLRDGFRAHIRSQHIKTQQVTSSAARNRRRSDTEALFTLWYDV